MSEKNIEARYVDNKFGLVLKNIDTNSIDDITKAVKLVLDEDSKVYELNSHYGDSNGVFSQEKIGFFVPINELILTERKGYNVNDLDRLYDSITFLLLPLPTLLQNYYKIITKLLQDYYKIIILLFYYFTTHLLLFYDF